MIPDVVVDIGNTRIKWGRCAAGRVVEAVAVSADEIVWAEQEQRWDLPRQAAWVVASVQPVWRQRLMEWLQNRGQTVSLVERWQQLQLDVRVQQPERVGIDRLFNAVAANVRRNAEVPAVLLDAGSAVTVDWLDAAGAFRGGIIMPGFRLMAHSLHDYTALLPLVTAPDDVPPIPGDVTSDAMKAGMYWAIVGSINIFVRQMVRQSGVTPQLFITGGDGGRLVPGLNTLPELQPCDLVHWPEMTLEGIRLTANALV